MSYLLTAEQRQIQEEARRLLEKNYSGERLKALLTRRGAFDEIFWRACRDMGWTGVTVPEAYGGLGLTPIELCIIFEECGRVAAGAPFLTTGYALSEALRLWGDEKLKQQYLPALAEGEIVGAFALVEAPGESEGKNARLRFSGGKLFGQQSCALAGATGDIALVAARDEPGHDDILVLVDLRKDAVKRTPIESLDNSRGVADLHFDGVEAAPLRAPDVKTAVRLLIDRLAILVSFEQIGGAGACLAAARDYANERQAFGQPIGKFQSIKHRIAEIYVANELARGNALSAMVALADGKEDLTLAAAAARLSATEAYEFAAREAMQVHGAIGVTWEHDLHLHYRRSRSLALELGSSLVWEDEIVDALEKVAS